jgi:hypothetical protein
MCSSPAHVSCVTYPWNIGNTISNRSASLSYSETVVVILSRVADEITRPMFPKIWLETLHSRRVLEAYIISASTIPTSKTPCDQWLFGNRSNTVPVIYSSFKEA